MLAVHVCAMLLALIVSSLDIDCINNLCNNTFIECNPNENCTIDCGLRNCHYSTIICPLNGDCDISCRCAGACTGITINATQQNGNFNLVCQRIDPNGLHYSNTSIDNICRELKLYGSTLPSHENNGTSFNVVCGQNWRSCQSSIMNCAISNPCHINCRGSAGGSWTSCSYSEINGPINYPFTVECIDGQACRGTIIDGVLSSSMDIRCSKANSCCDIGLKCPSKDPDGEKRCILSSSSNVLTACGEPSSTTYGTRLYAYNGFDDIDLLISGSWNTAINYGIMYYGADYSQNCTLSEWKCLTQNESIIITTAAQIITNSIQVSIQFEYTLKSNVPESEIKIVLQDIVNTTIITTLSTDPGYDECVLSNDYQVLIVISDPDADTDSIIIASQVATITATIDICDDEDIQETLLTDFDDNLESDFIETQKIQTIIAVDEESLVTDALIVNEPVQVITSTTKAASESANDGMEVIIIIVVVLVILCIIIGLVLFYFYRKKNQKIQKCAHETPYGSKQNGNTEGNIMTINRNQETKSEWKKNMENETQPKQQIEKDGDETDTIDNELDGMHDNVEENQTIGNDPVNVADNTNEANPGGETNGGDQECEYYYEEYNDEEQMYDPNNRVITTKGGNDTAF